MSLYDYQISKQLDADDYPFYSLIMAAYRRADTANKHKLESAFPSVTTELIARYRAPGGLLLGEHQPQEELADDFQA